MEDGEWKIAGKNARRVLPFSTFHPLFSLAGLQRGRLCVKNVRHVRLADF
jgi:hypothetical protein